MAERPVLFSLCCGRMCQSHPKAWTYTPSINRDRVPLACRRVRRPHRQRLAALRLQGPSLALAGVPAAVLPRWESAHEDPDAHYMSSGGGGGKKRPKNYGSVINTIVVVYSIPSPPRTSSLESEEQKSTTRCAGGSFARHHSSSLASPASKAHRGPEKSRARGKMHVRLRRRYTP